MSPAPTWRSWASTTSPPTTSWPTSCVTTRSWGASPVRSSRTSRRSPIDGTKIHASAERDPAALPWGDIGADIVIESTGLFTKAADAHKHIDAGAKKVMISAPATDEDITIVMGINDGDYDGVEAPRHLQRELHDELPRPDGQGAARQLGHRQGLHDHGARLHHRAAAARPDLAQPQGPDQPAPCARRCHQHHPDHHRRREGDLAGAAGAQGQARRLRPARPGARPARSPT